jgi:hypothetical protein
MEPAAVVMRVSRVRSGVPLPFCNKSPQTRALPSTSRKLVVRQRPPFGAQVVLLESPVVVALAAPRRPSPSRDEGRSSPSAAGVECILGLVEVAQRLRPSSGRKGSTMSERQKSL